MCPQCNAPKARFRKYDAEKNKAIGSTGAPAQAVNAAIASVVIGGILAYVGLSL